LKFALFFLLVTFVFSPIFGQNEIENADEFPSEERISQNNETQDDISQDSQSLRNNAAAVRGSISLESQGKKVRNHRYIVVSAVMMMLFIGLCMASVSSLNPE